MNGSQSIYSLSERLNLKDVLPNKVAIWQLRNNSPMRKSFIKNNIQLNQFEALIKLTAEMSKYLYPYIREILLSRDNFIDNPNNWNNFKKRYIDLISERYNTNSMRVKKLLDPVCNEKSFIKILLTLSLCISDNGYVKLRTILFDS